MKLKKKIAGRHYTNIQRKKIKLTGTRMDIEWQNGKSIEIETKE